MAGPAKIATCCYCGARAALTLSRRERHELACSNCGAPLHNLKKLPSKTWYAPAPKSNVSARQPLRKAKKKKKGKARRFFDFVEDAFDIVEDIWD